MSRCAVAACLILALAGAAAAADWTPMSRQEAIEATRNVQVDKRRLGYARLAEVGTMEDSPLVLAALWDEEELIRGMAEQVIWGIWMRTDDSVADPLFQTGIGLIVGDDPGAAIAKFDQVLTLKPEFAEGWNRRGDAFAALGDFDRALAEYDRAIALNPYHFGALDSCGRIWLERSDYRRAADFFRRSLAINPNQPELAGVLAGIEEKLGDDKI